MLLREKVKLLEQLAELEKQRAPIFPAAPAPYWSPVWTLTDSQVLNQPSRTVGIDHELFYPCGVS
jgi:hypothetical protein